MGKFGEEGAIKSLVPGALMSRHHLHLCLGERGQSQRGVQPFDSGDERKFCTC